MKTFILCFDVIDESGKSELPDSSLNTIALPLVKANSFDFDFALCDSLIRHLCRLMGHEGALSDYVELLPTDKKDVKELVDRDGNTIRLTPVLFSCSHSSILYQNNSNRFVQEGYMKLPFDNDLYSHNEQ